MSLSGDPRGVSSADGSASVLVTGAALAPEAATLLAEHGIRLHHAAPYSATADVAELAATLQVDGIIHRTGQLTAEVINASPRLRVIAKHGSGVDNIDLAAASARGVPVMRTLDANAQAVAEHTLALIFALMKDLFSLDRTVRAGNWPKSAYRGRDVAGSVMGIIGFGAIGQRVAARAAGLGMRVLVFDPYYPPDANQAGKNRLQDLDQLLAEADVVTLHCPLTPGTRHMIGEEQLRRMKPTAFLVNAARGGLVDETALAEALRKGTIAGAALDTFEIEPPAADNQFWTLPNVIVTPHIAGASAGAVRNMGVQAARHVIDVLQGDSPDVRSVANPDFRTADTPMPADKHSIRKILI